MDTFEMLSVIDEMIAIVEGKVEGKTWIKGNDFQPVETPEGQKLGMCLGGMMLHLMEGQRLQEPEPVVVSWGTYEPKPQVNSPAGMHGLHFPLREAIGRVILEQYADKVDAELRQEPATVVVPFNDDRETTKEDIIRVLEKTRVSIAEAV